MYITVYQRFTLKSKVLFKTTRLIRRMKTCFHSSKNHHYSSWKLILHHINKTTNIKQLCKTPKIINLLSYKMKKRCKSSQQKSWKHTLHWLLYRRTQIRSGDWCIYCIKGCLCLCYKREHEPLVVFLQGCAISFRLTFWFWFDEN